MSTGDTAPLASFPRLCALQDYLEDRCETEAEFHGMVFVRTRLVSNIPAIDLLKFQVSVML